MKLTVKLMIFSIPDSSWRFFSRTHVTFAVIKLQSEMSIELKNSTKDKMNGIVPIEENLVQKLIDVANNAKKNSYSPV